MMDLLEALKYTDEVISGEESPTTEVNVLHEEEGEHCTFYIVDIHYPDGAPAYDCERVAVILYDDGIIVTQRDWQTPTRLKKLADVAETTYTDWMSPQGAIVMLPTDGINMPCVLYGL